jgi:hypothetical protein
METGHSQISLTMDTYSHVMSTMLRHVAETMDTVLTAPARPRKHRREQLSVSDLWISRVWLSKWLSNSSQPPAPSDR